MDPPWYFLGSGQKPKLLHSIVSLLRRVGMGENAWSFLEKRIKDKYNWSGKQSEHATTVILRKINSWDSNLSMTEKKWFFFHIFHKMFSKTNLSRSGGKGHMKADRKSWMEFILSRGIISIKTQLEGCHLDSRLLGNLWYEALTGPVYFIEHLKYSRQPEIINVWNGPLALFWQVLSEIYGNLVNILVSPLGYLRSALFHWIVPGIGFCHLPHGGTRNCRTEETFEKTPLSGNKQSVVGKNLVGCY